MKLEKGIEKLKKSDKIWIKTDKSRNIYKICPSEYDKILHKIIDNHCDTLYQINNDTA